ncbi:MAG: hypothetical protein DHS20C01_26820 [marine bacterium B5-7]|nr:MAG: hypothetical protein DHS20C01_26820 [marine bacterium B5-7]
MYPESQTAKVTNSDNADYPERAKEFETAVAIADATLIVTQKYSRMDAAGDSKK